MRRIALLVALVLVSVAASVMVGAAERCSVGQPCAGSGLIGAPPDSACNQAHEYGSTWTKTDAAPPVLYLCGSAGWVVVQDGDAGPTGATGATGPTGAAGPTGAVGADGQDQPNPLVVECDGLTVSPCYVDLDGDDIRAASDSELELLAAPGAGKAVQISALTVATTDGSIPFSLASATAVYDGDSTSLFDTWAVLGQAYDMVTHVLLESEISLEYSMIEDKAILFIGETSDETGAILTSSLGDGGADYSVNDTFSVSNCEADVGVVDTVSSGAVVTYHFTANGNQCSTGTGQATSTGDGGTGLTIDIDTITPANGTARVYLDFQVLDLP